MGLTDVTTKLIQGYRRSRGAVAPKGPMHFPVPQTTWADVLNVYNKMLDHAEGVTTASSPSWFQMPHLLAAQLIVDEAYDFNEELPLWKQAMAQFKAQNPVTRAGGFFGDGWSRVLRGIQNNEVYPHNEQFWDAAKRFAFARDAAGPTPDRNDLWSESWKEAVREAPGTVKDALVAAAKGAGNVIPDLDDLARFLKWGTIAAGLGFVAYLYWKNN